MKVESFWGGKKRTVAQETAYQIALRRCSKEAQRDIRDFGEGRIHAIEHIFFQRVSASLRKLPASHQVSLHVNDCSRPMKSAPENISSADLWRRAPHPISALHPELLSGGVEGQQPQQRLI